MENQRHYFLKHDIFNKIFGVLLVIIAVLITILSISSLFETRSAWPLTIITFMVPMFLSGVNNLRNNVGYFDEEGIFYIDKKVRWIDITAVFFNNERYLIKSRTGQTFEIPGKNYFFHDEFDKRMEVIPNKGITTSPIRRWTAVGREYVNMNAGDKVMSFFDKHGSRKVPGYLVIIIVVVSLILIFTVNFWWLAIFHVNLVK